MADDKVEITPETRRNGMNSQISERMSTFNREDEKDTTDDVDQYQLEALIQWLVANGGEFPKLKLVSSLSFFIVDFPFWEQHSYDLF